MQTAMKLPPHILPTLDEIASTPQTPKSYESAVGVYIPGAGNDVGIYVPKPGQRNKNNNLDRYKKREILPPPRLRHRERPRSRPRRPRKRPRHRNRKKQQRQEERLRIPFDPKRPLNLISSVGSKVNELRNRMRNRKRKQTANRRTKTSMTTPSAPSTLVVASSVRSEHPYKFTPPDFEAIFKEDFGGYAPPAKIDVYAPGREEPSAPEYGNNDIEEYDEYDGFEYDYSSDVNELPPPESENLPPLRHNNPRKPRPPHRRQPPPSRRKRKNFYSPPNNSNNNQGRTPPPSPYVPTFVKEFLAKAFLKNPASYLAHLHGKQQKKRRRGGGKSPRQRRQRPRVKSLISPDRIPPPPPSTTAVVTTLAGFNPSDRFPIEEPYFDFHLPTTTTTPPPPPRTIFPVPREHLLQAWHDPRQAATTTVRPTALSSSSVNYGQVTNNNNNISDDYDYYDYADESLFGTTPRFGQPTIRPDLDVISAPIRQPPTTRSPSRGRKKRRRNKLKSRRSTICICCDEASTPRHRKNHAYSRRQLHVPEMEDEAVQMRKLLTERALIEQELDCSQHEPIEVVLIFDSQKKQQQKKASSKNKGEFSLKDDVTKTTFTLTPTTENIAQGQQPQQQQQQNEELSTVYYDPTKLSFIFSTPSPLSRRYMELRDREAMRRLSDVELLKLDPLIKHDQDQDDDENGVPPAEEGQVYFPASSKLSPAVSRLPAAHSLREIVMTNLQDGGEKRRAK